MIQNVFDHFPETLVLAVVKVAGNFETVEAEGLETAHQFDFLGLQLLFAKMPSSF